MVRSNRSSIFVRDKNVLSGEFAERSEAKAASEGTFLFETHKFFATFLQFNGIFQLFHVRTMTEGSPKDDRVEQLIIGGNY